ncbi:hypothetical protein F3Y22_tig00110283pilonHSYRG00019 [Hibiscus syriacus]|uniref:Uncharacterized protein n=1 Tax=Hibiscus syriacus TaxID=106335 RepID=A0A6A3B3I0_HIBSY|nr:hypothetical protein F3Y22_tig00110283pilonHSYRG00019 [Hibiscus syriacus]
MCEFRIKWLRNEDSILRNIRSRRKAQEHWDKVRNYIMYTWNCRTLDVDDHSKTEPVVVISCFRRSMVMDQFVEDRIKHCIGSNDGVAVQHQAFPVGGDIIPPPPRLELKSGSEIELSDIQKNFQRLYDYNVMLREEFIASQTLLRDLTAKTPPGTERQT